MELDELSLLPTVSTLASAAVSTAATVLVPPVAATLANRVLDGFFTPDAPTDPLDYEMAMLLDTAQPRAALEGILDRILRADVTIDVAGPAQTLQPNRMLVFLRLRDERYVSARARYARRLLGFFTLSADAAVPWAPDLSTRPCGP